MKLYIDTDKIKPGSEIALTSVPDDVVRNVSLSRGDVADVSPRRIAEIKVKIVAANEEGRHEVAVEAADTKLFFLSTSASKGRVVSSAKSSSISATGHRAVRFGTPPRVA